MVEQIEKAEKTLDLHWEKIEELAREAALPALGDLFEACGFDVTGKTDFNKIVAAQQNYHKAYSKALLEVQGKDFIPY